MKYAEYQTKHRELRVALSNIREPARAKEGKDTTSFLGNPTYRALDRELETLYNGAKRDYRISKSCVVRINFEFHLWIGISHDAYGNLMDVTHITPAELRLAADVKELVAKFVDGAIDELPPSGDWDAVSPQGVAAKQAALHELAKKWWTTMPSIRAVKMRDEARAYVHEGDCKPEIDVPMVWNLRLTLAISGPSMPTEVAPCDLNYFISTPTMTHCRKGHVALLHDGIWTCVTCGDSASADGKE